MPSWLVASITVAGLWVTLRVKETTSNTMKIFMKLICFYLFFREMLICSPNDSI
jgi:hypothetical protein